MNPGIVAPSAQFAQQTIGLLGSPTPPLMPGDSPAPNWRYVGADQWPKFRNSVAETIRTAPRTFSDTLVTVPGATTVNAEFRNGVLLPDGRVFLTPHNGTAGRIYNPATNSNFVPSVTFPGSNAYGGGVLLPDERVFLYPFYGTTALIYDPKTDTAFTPSGTYPTIRASEVFGTGCALLPDGRVFVHISNGPTRIYDPKTDTLLTGPTTGNGYLGCVLLGDGRVFVVPSGNSPARIYSPQSNSMFVGKSNFTATASQLSAGCLLPDGRVFCFPGNGGVARIYDPATDTVTSPTGSYPATDNIRGGCLLPDGRVYLHPARANVAYFYNPATDSVTTGTTAFPLNQWSRGIVMLEDGRIFCIPDQAGTSNTRIYGGFRDASLARSGRASGAAFSRDVLLSAYFNRPSAV